jgi:hypothetical protein
MDPGQDLSDAGTRLLLAWKVVSTSGAQSPSEIAMMNGCDEKEFLSLNSRLWCVTLALEIAAVA